MAAGDTTLTFRPWRNNQAARSLWVDEALEPDGARRPDRLEGEERRDVVIVGGGLSGLWTAIRLKDAEPSLSVALVEADQCGTGASGRNSGAVGHWWSRLPVLTRYFGEADAVRIVKASVAAIDDTLDFARGNGIDCQARIGPSVWSTNVPGQTGAWEGVFRMADRLGLEPPYRRLSASELSAMFGKGPYLAGVCDDQAVRIQPATLCRGLRAAAIARGVTVWEHSPVTRIDATPATLTVRTPGGRVRCGKLVLAANAWMAHLPEFRRTVMVLSSDIVITEPIGDLLDRLGMRDRPGGVNSRQMLNYGGLTPEGRVYLGRGGGSIAFDARIGPKFDHSAEQARQVEQDFRFLYPELQDVPIARSWAGPIDRCTTGLPRFDRLRSDPRIHYAIGYTGHGLGASNLGGRILASMVLERSDQWSELGAVLRRAANGIYPPEPLRYVAGTIVRGAVLRKELAERQGRRAWRLDAALSRLALATLPGRPRPA